MIFKSIRIFSGTWVWFNYIVNFQDWLKLRLNLEYFIYLRRAGFIFLFLRLEMLLLGAVPKWHQQERGCEIIRRLQVWIPVIPQLSKLAMLSIWEKWRIFSLVNQGVVNKLHLWLQVCRRGWIAISSKSDKLALFNSLKSNCWETAVQKPLKTYC